MSETGQSLIVNQSPSLVYCPHPLVAELGRRSLCVPFLAGESIEDYLARLKIPTKGRPWVLYLNGQSVLQQHWPDVCPKPGDLLTLRACVHGGNSDDKNKTTRTVLTIAVLLIAQNYEGVAQIAIASLGSYAVARLFPPILPELSSSTDETVSPTYNLNGGSNRARPFSPLPLVVGFHRVVPDLAVKPYTEFLGDDQYLFQVFNFGLGTINLSNFKIGDTPLSSFEDVETETAVGGTALTLFPTNVDTIAGADLTFSAGWIVRTGSVNATGLAVEVAGYLFYSGVDGITELQVKLNIEYRLVGDPGWTAFIGIGEVDIVNSSRKPVRWGLRISVPSGQYEVRMRRFDADETDERATSDLVWTQFRSYQPDVGTYEGQTRVALKIRANEQLRGQVDRFNAEAQSLSVGWDGEAWTTVESSNPAWLFLHYANGYFDGSRRLYGAGLDNAEIDREAIKAWGLWCDTKGLTCNLVFDQRQTVDQQLAIIARCGRAAPTRAGGVLGVVYDEGGQPAVAQFGMHNILKNTFRIEYASHRKIDEVVVNFVNPALNWQLDSVRATVPGVVDPVNALTIDLKGCTDEVMAGMEANLEAAHFTERRRRISWETDIEGLVVRRGDVVTLSHDLTQWGYSGRLLAGSNTVLTLDKKVPFTGGFDHYIGIRYPDGVYDIFPVNFQSGSGDVLTLSLPLVRDVWQATQPYLAADQVGAVVFNGFSYVVTVPGTSGATEPTWPLIVGDTVVDGGVTWKNDGEGFGHIPDADPDGFPAMDYTWFFEPKLTPGKRVKIIDFIPKSQHQVTLVATDENDEYYLSELNSYTYVPGSPGVNTPSITSLEISDTLIRVGNGFAVRLTLVWDVVGEYGGAVVRAAPNGETLEVLSRTFERRTELTWTHVGSVDIELTVINLSGEYGPGGTATQTYTLKGKDQVPSDVVNFVVSLDGYRLVLNWDPVPDVDLLDYEIRMGSDWDTGTLVARVNSTNHNLDVALSGTHDYLIKARDTTNNVSTTATPASITINLPSAPVITNLFDKADLVLSWVAVSGDFPIVEYEVRYGSTWAGGTFVDTIKASSMSIRASWIGTRRYWVAAIDAAGNTGSQSAVDVTVTAPGAPGLSRKVIDNNVLLFWSPAPGTLPIASHEIRRGDTFAGAEVIGQSVGSFTAIFESAAATYTYWAVGIDVAGNYGTEASVVALVNAPPDFVLREDWLSDFSGTKTNAFITQTGELLLPVNTTETWTNHFVNNSWADPQDQIDAGYSEYAMPSQATGSYEQEFDYGTVLEGTLISVIRNSVVLAGTVPVTTTISYKKLVGDSWTDTVSDQVYATDFRYVKVKLDVTSSGGDDLLRIIALNVQLSVKQITDEGNGAAVSTDGGGTAVTFNKSFIAAESVVVTPKTSSAVFAVVTGYDVANPTGFNVYLFDTSGTRVSGDFGWAARGN